jgi:TonB family protein
VRKIYFPDIYYYKGILKIFGEDVMTKLLLLFLVSLIPSTIFCQPEIPTRATDDTTYYIAVEVMPEPIGGIAEISDRLYYTEEAQMNNIEGKIYVLAYVNEEGTVDSTKILQGLGYGLDEIASDAVLQTKFTTAKQDNIPVKVVVAIPIIFKLD